MTAIDAFKPGVYRHWKGPLYRALFLAQDSTNRAMESSEASVVVYISLDAPHAGNICVRELWQWNEKVNWAVPNGVEAPPNDGLVHVMMKPRFAWVSP